MRKLLYFALIKIFVQSDNKLENTADKLMEVCK